MDNRDGEEQAPKAEAKRGRRLGDYQLLHEIGRGGMGVVFKANQVTMDRIVAVKVLPSFAGMDASAVTRFRREAEIAGRITHPGIVPVHTVGEDEGVHYYAMELVDGVTLYEVLETIKSRVPGRLRFSLVEESNLAEEYPDMREPPGRMSVGNRYIRSCVGLAADIANALAAAHDQRIVHRDLKPSNVMIRDQGRVALLDFGLARDELAVGLTRSGGDPLGTTLYMSPEQAAGAKDIDARTDIWALGALLYELLALRSPFVAAHDAEVLRRIREEEPSRLRRINPQVPAELEAIVHKCLAKQRDNRFPLVESLEHELRAFLAGEKLVTRSPNPIARILGSLRRNRRMAGMVAGAALLAFFAAGLTMLGSQHQTDLEGEIALEDARRALLESGDVEAAKRHYARARALLEEGPGFRDARIRHSREAFARYYPQRLALLETLYATLSQEELRELTDLTLQLAGRGKVRVDLAGRPGVAMHYRSYADGNLEKEWRDLPIEGELPIGDYLLRVVPPDCLPILRRVRVLRDRKSYQLTPLLLNSEAPSGMQPILRGGEREGFWIDAEEFSQSRLAALLRGLPRSLQRELTPTGAPLQDIDLPARGLSFYQARLIAMLLVRHLPSREEYMLAANAGFDLAFPWGSEFNPERLVADSDYLRGPKRVGGQDAGASPYGVRHLLGNVAELLAPGEDRRLFLAGGHYQSLQPDRLRLDQPGDLFEQVAGKLVPWRVAPAHAGMRLLRFLPPPDDYAAAHRIADEWKESEATAGASISHDWQLSDEGQFEYRLRLRGTHAHDTDELGIPFVTKGFLQGEKSVLLDGHGRDLDFEQRIEWYGDASEFRVHLAQRATKGQSYTIELHSHLRGLSSMQLIGDSYLLRLPMKTTGSIPVMYRLRLPTGCQVTSADQISPDSFSSYFVRGHQELVWQFMPGEQAAIRSMPVVVRFRRDGLLTPQWPLWNSVASLTERFFTALANQDRENLADLLHPAYLEHPAGIGRDRRLAKDEDLGGYSNWRIVDVHAIGSVVSVDLSVDWQARVGVDKALDLEAWPLRLQWVREDRGLSVIRLGPRSRSDTGELADDGSYAHSELKLHIEADAETSLVRGQDEAVDLQVSSNFPDDPEVRCQILGHLNEQLSRDQVELILTAGGRPAFMGELIPGELEMPISIKGAEADRRTIGLLFGSDREAWTRERWTFVTRGLRHFLIKVSAPGSTQREAENRLARAEAWIDSFARRIVIE